MPHDGGACWGALLKETGKQEQKTEMPVYLYSAPNPEQNKAKKETIKQFHYFLTKAHFDGYAAYEKGKKTEANESENAYVVIAVSERVNGDFFYDLDATDIESVDKNLGTSDTLLLTRVPNAESQADVPKGGIQQVKQFVNNLDKLSAENSSATASESSFSLAPVDDETDMFAPYNEDSRGRRSTLEERMIRYCRSEANRIRRSIKGSGTPQEAAQVMASVLVMMNAARKYVDGVRLPRLTAKRAALEAYVRMMQEGRIGVNRNGSLKRSGLSAEELAAVEARAQQLYEEAQDAESSLTESPLNKQHRKELMRDSIRNAAREGIGAYASDIANDIMQAIAENLSAKIIDSMRKQIANLAPSVVRETMPKGLRP